MRRLLFISVFSIFLAGCSKSVPLQNINESPVPTAYNMTASDVAKAIRTAAITKRWTISEEKPGYMEASITVRNKHTAVVGIPYTDKTYNIEYIRSSNLNHKGDKIHRNYRKWVTLLDREIQAELSRQ